MRTVFLLEGFIKGYARKAMYIQDITHHPSKHIIEHRLKIFASDKNKRHPKDSG